MTYAREKGDPNRDEQTFVLQRLAYLSAHEVGHTLGIDHNWAGTTYGWGSVMDYLGPNVRLRDGDLDLSDAYATDIGAWDRLVVQWGYTPGLDRAARDAMVHASLAEGITFPLTSDPRWAEYDWGTDPAEWLATTMEVRQEILRRFGPAQLRPGETVYSLQERLPLAYLYHRFGIQAAQQHVGGQYQEAALAGDEGPAARWVPAEHQRRALDLLVAALEPAQLDLPEDVIGSLTQAPHGWWTTREEFPSASGPVWSLLTAARSLADLVVRPLLSPERAARLTLPSQVDALSLTQLLQRLGDATWGAAPPPDERRRALQRVAQRSVLDGIMDLAAAPESSPEVRAAAIAEMERLREVIRTRRVVDAHAKLAIRELTQALEDPAYLMKRRPPVAAPPGRPI